MNVTVRFYIFMRFSFVELSSATSLSLILLIVSDSKCSLVMDCWKKYLYSVLSLWGGKNHTRFKANFKLYPLTF